jgi:hypothetical protein
MLTVYFQSNKQITGNLFLQHFLLVFRLKKQNVNDPNRNRINEYNVQIL